MDLFDPKDLEMANSETHDLVESFIAGTITKEELIKKIDLRECEAYNSGVEDQKNGFWDNLNEIYSNNWAKSVCPPITDILPVQEIQLPKGILFFLDNQYGSDSQKEQKD